MADAWDWLVGEVERGYEDLVDEYSNDLYCRNWLHLAWPRLDNHTVLTGHLGRSLRAAGAIGTDPATGTAPAHE